MARLLCSCGSAWELHLQVAVYGVGGPRPDVALMSEDNPTLSSESPPNQGGLNGTRIIILRP